METRVSELFVSAAIASSSLLAPEFVADPGAGHGPGWLDDLLRTDLADLVSSAAGCTPTRNSATGNRRPAR